ncbi:hypothetical protein HHI36_014817 [Cryptolaemus montrouzieri]|uniref:Peptidase A2 domain-containing protein n=1 Tax=Cryptolaemus montrouzieri TaxID=559131 RepID=A0ABD2N409_9CUCU
MESSIFSDSKDMSVSAFLEHVEELSCSKHVTKLELFDSKQFQPYDYDDRLFEEAKRRTQGENENIGIYVACMTNLFSRSSITVPKSAQLKIMLRHLNPFFQLHLGLTEVTSIDYLIELCNKLKMKRHSVESYSNPLSRKPHLEPYLAYVGPSTSSSPSSLKVVAVTCCNCNKSESVTAKTECTVIDRIILDYIIAHSRKDKRLYPKVNIYGEKYMGLLDSGATRTIMGKIGWDLLSKSKVVLDTDDAPSCSVANRESFPSIGSVCLPIDLMGKIKLVLIVPSLKHCLILG